MQRITISIDQPLAVALDALADSRAYSSRSEAVRDLVRDGIERWRSESAEFGFGLAYLAYIFDRRIRDLPTRLAEFQHAAHDLVISTSLVRLDHFNTLETVILRGDVAQVRDFANRVRAERGVRLSSFNMVQVEPGDDHRHPQDHQHSGRLHMTPCR